MNKQLNNWFRTAAATGSIALLAAGCAERTDQTYTGVGAEDEPHTPTARVDQTGVGAGGTAAYDQQRQEEAMRDAEQPAPLGQAEYGQAEQADLRQIVVEHLRDEVELSPQELQQINVEVHEGIVTLSGRVVSEEVSFRIEREVESIEGVSFVRNNLQS